MQSKHSDVSVHIIFVTATVHCVFSILKCLKLRAPESDTEDSLFKCHFCGFHTANGAYTASSQKKNPYSFVFSNDSVFIA